MADMPCMGLKSLMKEMAVQRLRILVEDQAWSSFAWMQCVAIQLFLDGCILHRVVLFRCSSS